MNRITYVYALLDPRDNQFRYVGASVHPKERAQQHLEPHRLRNDTYKNQWLRGLLAAGLKPKLVILQECEGDSWDEAERRFIRELRAQGHSLTNVSLGGKQTGVPWGTRLGISPSAEAREKQRRSKTGQRHTPEAIEKIRQASLGRTWSDERKRLAGELKAKTFVVTFPDGHEETVTNLAKFCREQGLYDASMGSVASGNASHHKGFKCRRV